MSEGNGNGNGNGSTGMAFVESVELNPNAGPTLIESLDSQQLKVRELSTQLSNALNNQELLQEALMELEIALEDVGWFRMTGAADREFSVTALRKLRRLARLSYLKNPLVKHGVEVQTHYVWGQGCSVSCRDAKVNEVIAKFLGDPKNTAVFTGHQARLDKERELMTHGDLFLALFTNPSNGRVIVRAIFPDEITEIITNPQDRHEPWFYKREWSENTFDALTGATGFRHQTCFYPDWRFTYNRDKKIKKPKQIGGNPVMWNAPIYHIKVGGFADMKFGVPEVYSALDWARAVSNDMSDYATVRRAHSRYAFTLTNKSGGKAGVATAKKFLGTTLNADGSGQIETNPPPATGSTAISTDGWNLAAMRTAGAQPNPEEGRRLWLLCAAGMGIPLTILSGDADVGNLATAKTLDRPTELQMESRRTLWADVYIDILGYVIDMAAIKPNGMLSGHEDIDVDSGTSEIIIDGVETRDVIFRFPSILQRDVQQMVAAIVAAVTLNGKASAALFDDKTIASMLLTALGEDEVDPIVNRIFPDDAPTFNAGNNNIARPQQGAQSSTDDDQGDMGDAGQVDPGTINPGAQPTEYDFSASLRQGAMRAFLSEATAVRVAVGDRSRMMDQRSLEAVK